MMAMFSGKVPRSLRLPVKRLLSLLLVSLLALPASFMFMPGAMRPAQAVTDAAPVPDVWVPNGIVNSILPAGDTTYIGGNFTYVGPNTGYGAPIDTTCGSPAAIYPKVNGYVNATVGDGSGGWYIGGAFTTVGGVARNRLAHIFSDGTLDPAWDPNANSTVHALALSGSTVYAGGEFTTLKGGTYTRNRLAAIDAATGTPTAWDPGITGVLSCSVNAIALSGSTVYVAGEFFYVQGASGGPYTRWRIAAIDAATGNPTTWDPCIGGGVMDPIHVLAVSGSTVYVGGQFDTVQGASGGPYTRNNLAAIDAATGNPTAWDPNADSGVFSLALSGSTLYIGGFFHTIQGASGGPYTRNHIAAIDAATGNPTAWDPDADNTVFTLALSGATLYAGGAFAAIQGTSGGPYTRNHIAAIDVATGNPTAWDPSVSDLVQSITVSGPTVYAGGRFNSIGGRVRNHIAAIDTGPASPTYGTLTDWDPGITGLSTCNVNALVRSGSTVYAGGQFTTVQGASGGPYTRNNLAAIDAATGNPTAWDPNADSGVFSLALSGSILYAGGNFNAIQGASGGPYTRNNIAAIDMATGNPTAWDPGADSAIWALALDGSTVYAGGQFTTIQGASGGPYARNYIAAIDAATGNPTAWDPDADKTVYALALSGSTVYAGGQFTTMGGLARNRIAAIDAANGDPTAWDPGANNWVQALAVSGSTVYAGGHFTTMGGLARNRIAEIDMITGNPTAWDPDADKTIYSLALSGSTVYAGGWFTTMNGGVVRTYLAVFTEQVVVTSITPDNGVNFASVSVTDLAGTGFEAGAEVALRRTGQDDIIADNVVVVSPEKISCDLDLNGALIGGWDVVVTNPDGREGTLQDGFTISDGCVIDASAGPGGSITPGGPVDVAYGEDQAFTITPDEGFHVADVVVDGSSQGPVTGYTFNNVTGYHTIESSFALDEHTVTASVSGGHGSVSPATQQVAYAQDASIDITPDPGYHIATITDNGAPADLADPFVISGVSEDHAVEVTFAADELPGATWYLAEGCTDGGMETWVLVQNPLASEVTVDLTLMTSSGEQKPAGLQGQAIPAASRRSFNLGAYVTDYDVSTKVSATGGEVVCERSMYGNGKTWGHDSVGTNAPATTWYQAEGCTDGGTETWVLVQNPGAAEVTVDLALQTSSGERKPEGLQGVTVPANTRRSFKLNDFVTDYQVSTTVTSSAGVICERSMYGPDKTWGTNSIGVTAPAATWYLAEGCTDGGMETWVLVQNPGAAEVAVDLALQTSSGELRPEGLQGVAIPGGTRRNFKLNDYVTDYDVSTKVSATGGEVACERSMYGNGKTWGHDSVGTNAPATTWYLAEGCTEGEMETWVLVQNPGAEEVAVDLTLQTSSGELKPEGLQGVAIPAGTRRGFRLNDYVTDYDVSTLVAASGGVVCERAVYGPGKTWGTDSIGYPAP